MVDGGPELPLAPAPHNSSPADTAAPQVLSLNIGAVGDGAVVATAAPHRCAVTGNSTAWGGMRCGVGVVAACMGEAGEAADARLAAGACSWKVVADGSGARVVVVVEAPRGDGDDEDEV
eukprot:ctg_760.g180